MDPNIVDRVIDGVNLFDTFVSFLLLLPFLNHRDQSVGRVLPVEMQEI